MKKPLDEHGFGLREHTTFKKLKCNLGLILVPSTTSNDYFIIAQAPTHLFNFSKVDQNP